MTHDLDSLKAYLEKISLSDVQHTHDDLLSHLVGVYRLLRQWDRQEHVAIAGLFHSVYGTEGFPHQSVPLERRGEVRELVGGRAEALAYAYSAMTYDSLQASVNEGESKLVDRFTDLLMDLSQRQYKEVLWIKLADTVEQATEKTWQSSFFQRMAEQLGSAGQKRWEEEKKRFASSQMQTGV